MENCMVRTFNILYSGGTKDLLRKLEDGWTVKMLPFLLEIEYILEMEDRIYGLIEELEHRRNESQHEGEYEAYSFAIDKLYKIYGMIGESQ